MNIFGLELGRQRQSGTGADAAAPAAGPASGLALPVSTLEPRMGPAGPMPGGMTMIGAVGQAQSGLPTGTPRIGSLRAPAGHAQAGQAAPTASAASTSIEARVAQMETGFAGMQSVLSAMAAKMGIAAPAAKAEREDPAAKAEREDPGDEDDETPEGALEAAGGDDEEDETAEPVLRTPSQVRAACAGASAQFVEGVLEAGLTATQAKKLFAMQSSAAPVRRNRAPVGGQPGGAQAAGSTVPAMIQNRMAEYIQQGKPRQEAEALACRDVKRTDPAGYFRHVENQDMDRRRKAIGAAPAAN